MKHIDWPSARGRVFDASKPHSFNQPWTREEQCWLVFTSAILKVHLRQCTNLYQCTNVQFCSYLHMFPFIYILKFNFPMLLIIHFCWTDSLSSQVCAYPSTCHLNLCLRLDELLVTFPPEFIAANRYRKIAEELGKMLTRNLTFCYRVVNQFLTSPLPVVQCSVSCALHNLCRTPVQLLPW